jgi:hypothetical protein
MPSPCLAVRRGKTPLWTAVPTPKKHRGARAPADKSFCGTAGFVQVLELDPSAVLGVSFSRGLRLLLGI